MKRLTALPVSPLSIQYPTLFPYFQHIIWHRPNRSSESPYHFSHYTLMYLSIIAPIHLNFYVPANFSNFSISSKIVLFPLSTFLITLRTLQKHSLNISRRSQWLQEFSADNPSCTWFSPQKRLPSPKPRHVKIIFLFCYTIKVIYNSSTHSILIFIQKYASTKIISRVFSL
jgi:hypothetical protein